MADKQMVQLTLAAQIGPKDFSTRTCWVNADRTLKAGVQVTLKDSENPDRRWTIMRMSQPKSVSQIHTEWSVGGVEGRR